MNPIVRNIIAVIAGFIMGSIVNMSIVMLSAYVIPPPEGIDPTNMEALKESMHLFKPYHFLFPFLAHALGTLVGAGVAAAIAVSHKMNLALGIGAFFMLGGLINVFLLPAPTWFILLDLTFAYLPMAHLGAQLAQK